MALESEKRPQDPAIASFRQEAESFGEAFDALFEPSSNLHSEDFPITVQRYPSKDLEARETINKPS
ncbi:MAG: hypothetical protein A3B38_03775 [Candidatus Levybacteria bacterium RIFCSPLOWO2_01_FULL_36_13]|nr:MAG: hypothetical protein A2684_00710 [Candidatus Levybacteria bacterium RIFCSPHIGHO2_01_FULL_36_15b]OGH34250.1 MAG: hypothetical protein A3B38_03775 [Candidatus Levybacteria bacterium RIFCSPLOWO2_01_FULL_36_13]